MSLPSRAAVGVDEPACAQLVDGSATPPAAASNRPGLLPAAAPTRHLPPLQPPRPQPPPAASAPAPAAAPAQWQRSRKRGAAGAAARALRRRRRPRRRTDAEAGDADRLGDGAVARSARRTEAGTVGRRPGRVEHEHGFDDAAEREGRSARRTPISRSPANTRSRATTTASTSTTSRTREAGLAQRYLSRHRRTTSRSTRTCSSCRRKRPTAATTAVSAACRSRSARLASAASASSTSRT